MGLPKLQYYIELVDGNVGTFAKRAGVSHPSIYRLLDGGGGVTAVTAYRCLKAIKDQPSEEAGEITLEDFVADLLRPRPARPSRRLRPRRKGG